MKIDIHADAPFNIKDDIDTIYWAYHRFLSTYGIYISIFVISSLIIYFFYTLNPKKQEEEIEHNDDYKIANQERMREIRRRQVGDSLKDRVQQRKQHD